MDDFEVSTWKISMEENVHQNKVLIRFLYFSLQRLKRAQEKTSILTHYL